MGINIEKITWADRQPHKESLELDNEEEDTFPG